MKKSELMKLSVEELEQLNIKLMNERQKIRVVQLLINEVMTEKIRNEKIHREMGKVKRNLGITDQDVSPEGIESEEMVLGI